MGKKSKRVYKPIVIESKEWYIPLIGNTLQISGVLFDGGNDSILLLMPHSDQINELETASPSVSEWSEILTRSDDPVYMNNFVKPWLRKAERTISGIVQQQIWALDKFRCQYCGIGMGGKVLMTIDHFIPLETGGLDEPGNYLTACRRCNKDKADIPPDEWLNSEDYQELTKYLLDR